MIPIWEIHATGWAAIVIGVLSGVGTFFLAKTVFYMVTTEIDEIITRFRK